MPALPAPPVERKVVGGAGGSPDVTFYLINSDFSSRRPAIVHMHGGGYIAGTPLQTVTDLQDLAKSLDCTIATVDYRLAPEWTFASSMEDNYAVLRWLHRHSGEVGVDRDRIAVMGESAGGGHAALLALMARDRGEVPICFQMLIYPMLDDRTGSIRRPNPPIGSLVWTAENNRFGWSAFLGVAAGSISVPSRAVPARYVDLSRLPPTFIGVGSIDLFVDECMDYATRLIDSDVSTQLMVVPGAFHIFDYLAPNSTLAKSFLDARHAALLSAFKSDRA